jgi:cytochrome c peroxidase
VCRAPRSLRCGRGGRRRADVYQGFLNSTRNNEAGSLAGDHAVMVRTCINMVRPRPGPLPEERRFSDANVGKQKVPTLRNVDRRPTGAFVKAYMHNGYFKTLSGLVHFYNTRDVKAVCSESLTERDALARDCWPAPEVTANINKEELGNLGLSQAEENAIVVFMETLSDGYVPATASGPR